MERIDFSRCPSSGIKYGGSEKKAGILFNGSPFMLKFRKNNIYGPCFNDVAEFIGSHVFSYLGLPSQTTLLGTYEGEKVVACKDFLTGGWRFTPFRDLGESSIDDEPNKYRYKYLDIETLIRKNKKLKDPEGIIALFWQTYIVDALLGNPDRHGRNWGFLKKGGAYSVCPVFDNGSSLFSSFSDEGEMKYVLSHQEEINERVFETPRSLILDDDGVLSDYSTIISSLRYPHCNESLLSVMKRLDIAKVSDLIESTDLSAVQKDFLKTMTRARFELILVASYKKLLKGSA